MKYLSLVHFLENSRLQTTIFFLRKLNLRALSIGAAKKVGD